MNKQDQVVVAYAELSAIAQSERLLAFMLENETTEVVQVFEAFCQQFPVKEWPRACSMYGALKALS